MGNSEDTGVNRLRRLDEVRREIEKAIASGKDLVADEWIQKYPDLNPELGELLAKVLAKQAGGATVANATLGGAPIFGETVDGATVDGAGRNPVNSHDEKPAANVLEPVEPLPAGLRVRYIGDYELLSVLGQGGMGVVYKARQISLNRDVALKMIRNSELASEDQVRRFQNEAEAVALFDHPAIVPIYEVGLHGDQRYFSMKLIDGAGLDKRLKSAPLKPRVAAELVAEVAEAIHHAHQRGLLHRDLKPANILVDAEGHPHVTDFGLAKRMEQESGLTMSGEIMGTPAYMAPEQALGKNSAVTTASDVYGLGGILYAALTGRDPFQGDSLLEILHKVRAVAPDKTTSIDKKIPRDLEIICLKCLEKDQNRRYASAQEVADDLHRWLKGEPIVARPVNAVARSWMWCKRRPALAALGGALAVAIIVGVIGIVWQWRAAVFQRNEAVAARDAAQKNAQLAATQATLALSTIQDLVTDVQSKLSLPNLYDLKMSLLKTAQTRMENVAAVYDKSNSNKEASMLAIDMEFAKIYQQLGQSDKAADFAGRSLEIAKARVIIKENSDASRSNLALIYAFRGLLYEEFGRDMKSALNENQQALRIWQDINNHPNNKPNAPALDKKAVRNAMAESTTRVAADYLRIGDIEAARDGFRKAYDLRQELVRDFPNDSQSKQFLSYSTMALAGVSFLSGNPAQADDYYRQTLQWREKMFAEKPKDQGVISELADVNFQIGEFKLETGDLVESRKRFERSKELRAALVQADPRNAMLRRKLAMSFYRLGSVGDLEGNKKSALESFEAARKLGQQLVDEDPQNDKRLMELMEQLAHVGQIDKAVAIIGQLSAVPVQDNELRVEIARCYAQSARTATGSQAARKEEFLLAAMESLRAAVANGFRDPVTLETEPDLDPLRTRNDFRALVASIQPK
jgi:tetratricopeptide (TPR) repeat protein/tRNA A-37 threonylcarbamoyl transferase component Bud32